MPGGHMQSGHAGDRTSGPMGHNVGTPQPAESDTRVCMVCGATNQTKAHFCGRCGSLAGRPPGDTGLANGVLWESRILKTVQHRSP